MSSEFVFCVKELLCFSSPVLSSHIAADPFCLHLQVFRNQLGIVGREIPSVNSPELITLGPLCFPFGAVTVMCRWEQGVW